MKIEKLKEYWLFEEQSAQIHGWDFSHIDGRYRQPISLPWDYKEVVQTYLRSDTSLLDIDTGGGEFLLSLKHPYCKTSATEGYAPNVTLCKAELLPLGIDFREMSQYSIMPFSDNSFDVIINRHGNYDISELYRILKPGGFFITQQVGDNNDRELVELLLPNLPHNPPQANLKVQSELFKQQGFQIIRGEEAFRPIEFYDVGALVWFAGIIEWEFCGFSVEKCFDNLLEAQGILEKQGAINGHIHRYLIIAKK